ncbi:hypothetical protein [Streptomyces sp. NPDC088725]|uniref:hypothetical protein n=1 Tax=Streptomyces sp. NPDC088725 TaxID=3365873 RepID=UPI00381E5D42
MTYRRIISSVSLLAALALSGCAPSPGGSLDAQPGTPSPTCRVHQRNEPAAKYSAGSRADTRAVLELLRYYTANGTKSFCDGKAASRTDRRWSDLYTRLVGEHGNRPGRDTQVR